ncbi:MAG: hypothetical protein KDA24_09640, partial [Deltaproteobacteria bacterium]|nr:hypothetical protein [Deltaproteobacteria bacterium]
DRSSDDDDSAAGSDDDDDAGDDDDAAGDDDDATGDDDDATGDDDDATGDDDDATGDDDDATGDDDDATGPPPTDPLGMLDETYCLDWNSVNVIEPSGLINILGILGISITDYPLLISPTVVDVANEEIEMLVTGALQGTCNQDLTISTVDLAAGGPGVYTPPLFEVGPADFSTVVDGLQLTIYEMFLSGQFSVDSSQIYDGTVLGQFLVPAEYESTACALLACIPCPGSTPSSCLNFVAEDAVFNDTGAGAMTVVP